jgi:hypothetical protein
MMTVEADPVAKFHAILAAAGRSLEIPESQDAYGWLVGSWELDVKRYWAVDVSAQHIKGEVHAGWTLEGRAVQDVWIMPRRGERSSKPNKKLNMYGTTLRAWDSSIQAWRIMWSNPAGDHFEQQIGRWINGEVVQLGARPDGSLTRWRFTEITANSFHWFGEALGPDGQTWNVEGEFLAKRIS